VYEQFAALADQMTTAFLERTIQAGIRASLGWMRGALMLMVTVAAVLVWTGRLDLWWVVRRVVIALIVITLLQAGAYNQYVRDVFWTTIPNLIATAFAGGGVSVTAARRFDVISDAASHVVAAADAQAGGLWNFRAQFGIALAHGLMLITIGLCFALWLVARVATALLIAVGPFLLIAAIFDATRGWVIGWASKLVTLAVWSLCSTALAEMMLAGTLMWVQRTAANAAGLSERVDGLWKLCVWILIDFGVMMALPYFAAVNSGAAAGVHVGASGAAGIAGAVAGRLGSAAAAVNRAATRLGRSP
jgi:type IV secretion system protein VirB6